MGKSKPKRFGSLRPNPLGISITHSADAELDGADQATETTPSAISNIIEKIQAPSTEERACGCNILASVVSEPSAIGHLLNKNAVRITAPLFLDSCLDVRKSALGALKNMSVYGQDDVCEVMMAQDVFTPLVAILKEYGQNWTPLKEATKCDTATDVLVEAVELLANLCESSAAAVHQFNNEGLIMIILPMLKVETYGYSLSCAVARCLHVVSENNPTVSSILSQPGVLSEMQVVISVKPPGIDSILYRTLITGILLNIVDIDHGHYYNNIVSTAVDALDFGLVTAIDSALETHHQTAEELDFDPGLTWPVVDKLISAQAVSLELLANLCCTGGEWEDADGEGWEESSSDDQGTGQESHDVDMAGDTGESMSLPSDLKSAFLQHNILSKVMSMVSPFHQELVKRLEGSHLGKAVLKKYSQLQQRALLCLSNLVEAIDESFLASSSISLAEMWGQIYKIGHSDEIDEDMKWAVTSSLRAIIQRIAVVQPNSPCDMSENDLNFLVGLASSSDNTEIQINVLRVLSTLGCIMSQQNQINDSFKKIGTMLLEVALGNANVVIVAEALDSLFDVFKEDHTDAVAREILLVDRLKSLQPSFKSQINSQKKTLGENVGVVTMAKTNLNRFIKYKLSQR